MQRLLIWFWLALGLALCTLSCAGPGSGGVHSVDLSVQTDSLVLETFRGEPSGKLTVEVEAGSATVPFGLEDALHVGLIQGPDSSRTAIAYLFSLTPDAVDTVSATALRYHFTTGRSGRLMLLSAQSGEGIPEAVNILERRISSGWNSNN